MILTFVLVVFGWILFREDSIADAWLYIQRIFTQGLFTLPDASGITGFTLCICIMLVVEWLQRRCEHPFELGCVKPAALRYAIYLATVFAILMLGGHTENFIYFQF